MFPLRNLPENGKIYEGLNIQIPTNIKIIEKVHVILVTANCVAFQLDRTKINWRFDGYQPLLKFWWRWSTYEILMTADCRVFD